MFSSSKSSVTPLSEIDVILLEKDGLLAEKDDIIEKKSEVIAAQQQRIKLLEEALRLGRHKRFGSSSEANSGQGDLFGEALCAVNDPEEPEVPEEGRRRTKKGGGRKPLAATIPREQIRIYLTPEEREGAINTFFVMVKEELDKVPGKVRVLEYMVEKAVYKTAEGQQKIKTAQMPKHPLGKAIASINLLAYIIISKYMDCLPLYRLEGILKRYGGSITRATMANWLINLSIEFQPLVHLMRDHQLQSNYLQADETTIQVLKEEGYSPSSKKYIWVIRGGPPGQPCITFEYDPSRRKEVATRLLDGFEGYLQADGYDGYNDVCQSPSIIRLGCWDHCRRHFKDAQNANRSAGKEQKKQSLADAALIKIGALYFIEKKLREKKASPDEIYRTRQAESIPKLKAIKSWVDDHRHNVPKDSLTGKAFTYLVNQWPRLLVYCENGNLHISNIFAENSIRPIALGRRNWLFADTPKGARASAIYYSLIETAKANGLDPYDYLCYVLKRLPYATTVEQMEALLPWTVKHSDEYRKD